MEKKVKNKEHIFIENCVNNCSGCRVCQYLCPNEAIHFYEDEEGFMMPKVDRDKCIQCNKCVTYCQGKIGNNVTNIAAKEVYAARNKNLDIVKESSSGGVFSALAEYIILNGGIVYGVGMENNINPTYMRITKVEEIIKLRGSKYVEAEVDEKIIKSIFDDIDNNKDILFVGTPCIVSGIQGICKIKKKNADKIVWVDLLCAGAISRKIWKGYLNKYTGQNIKNISFRNKDLGWREFSLKIDVNDRIDRSIFGLTDLGKLFFKDETKRRSCLGCKFSSLNRVGDITIGDFWNEIYLPKKWQDNKGVSKIIINTEKGSTIINKMENYMDIVPMSFYKCYCSVLENSSYSHDNEKREKFWEEYNKYGYEYISSKYGRLSFTDIILYKVIRPFLIKTKLIKYLVWLMNCRGTRRFKKIYENNKKN